MEQGTRTLSETREEYEKRRELLLLKRAGIVGVCEQPEPDTPLKAGCFDCGEAWYGEMAPVLARTHRVTTKHQIWISEEEKSK